ncbi:MAG: M36 family metallopeptidase [Gemmataceae bacterium]|nr:M36 family metallopeptidase [Gemmataceae bacterium]
MPSRRRSSKTPSAIRTDRYRRLPLSLLRLEDRTVPSGTGYLPPSQFLYNTDLSAGPVRAGDAAPLAIALDYLRGRASELGVTQADLANPLVTSQYTDTDTGIYHAYLRQTAFGLPVVNADFSVAVAANGAVISVGGGFVAGLEDKLAGTRTSGDVMNPTAAIAAAASKLGLELEATPTEINPVVGPVQAFVFSAPSVSVDEIAARLQYAPTADGSAVLTWHMVMQTPDGNHWYDLNVDAVTGSIVALADWIDDAAYSAVNMPSESPQDGRSAVITNAANATASPFGWHDTNGVAGAEFTDTRGNNVDAHLDRNADNAADTSPARPDGGSNLNFSGFLFNPALEPTALQNQNAAVVNLFHMNNVLHDVHYQYGFTEAAGNFQTNNYGKGGSGNDAVQADAQDGSGTNNANFGTPVDGSAPRMQMYIWTSTTPDRDSDLDNGVIIHEYGHGVSNRLTGGPANSSALNSTQSGGMGEGWSDYYALMLTQRPTDVQNGSFGIGTYLIGQAQTGTGIRRRPYSFDMTVNPLTFDAYGTSGTTSYGITRSTEVHNTGELWATTLWDMNWMLINKYGYDPNLYTGWSNASAQSKAGNKLALRLVMDGLKLQPANPSFTQARDAIIAADVALNGGADLFEIWTAFSRRGLGVNAVTSASSATTITVDTSMPMLVAGANPVNRSVVSSSPGSYVLNVNAAVDGSSLQASDFTVNGQPASSVAYTAGDTSMTFTFAVNPVSAEGLQTISVAAGAFTRASDGSAVGAFSSNFYYDATPVAVTSVTPTSGATVQIPFTTIDINLNQAVDPATVQASDLSVTQGKITGVSLLNGNTTLRFTLAEATGEGTFYGFLAAGAVSDLQGNPNAQFNATYTLDNGVVPFPGPLQSRIVRGSLIYDGIYSGEISTGIDVDTFSIDLDANQSLTVIVTPNGGLQPRIAVTGPGTNQVASGAVSGVAQVAGIPITTAGTYNLAVSSLSGTTGGYTIQVVLNTINEAEANGGAANDSLATAQSLSTNMVSLGAGVSRVSVRGRMEGATVPEIEANDVIASATPVTVAAGTPTGLYQLGISGTLSSGTDADYFNIGALQVGDVLTVVEGGITSTRGTSNDPVVRLYRAGTTSIVTSDDDSGPGTDSMIYRYTITTADTYYVRAYRFNTAAAGSYQLGVYLENTGAVPGTGGTFNAEVEPNETTGTANNASTSWKPVKYVLSAGGTIAAGDTDLFQYQFNAGEVVSLLARSTSGLITQAALLDSAGIVLALEDGTSSTAGAGGFSPIYGYVIPTTGTYYFRVNGASGTTGSYTADVYLSTTTTMATLPPSRDLYSFSLNAGQAATLTINNVTAGNLDIAILDGAGTVVAAGVAGSTNVAEITADFSASAAGTYFAQVQGDPGVEYQLSVQTGGTFDAEANDSFATAQSMNGNAALGAINGNDDWYQFSVTAGQPITVSTLTPGGDAGEFVNTLDPSIELYSPANVLVSSDDNSGPDGRNAALSVTAGSSGQYRVRVRGAASTSGEYIVKAQVGSAGPPPQVAGFVFGDGTTQRSRVKQAVVTFNQLVSLPVNPADAFQVVRQSDNVAATFTALVTNGAATSVTLTFTGGPVEFQSLADGRYTLTVLANNVSGAGGSLDGDGNGTGGDNFVAVGTQANGLYRLYGDSNGDGTVDSTDFLAFRTVFLLPNEPFDFDASGAVEVPDFIQFRLRFLQSI